MICRIEKLKRFLVTILAFTFIFLDTHVVPTLCAHAVEEELIQINIQVPRLNTEEVMGDDGRKYYKLSLPESYCSTQEEGAPQILFIRKLIQIPADAQNIKLGANYKTDPIVYNDILIYPSPKRVVKETPEGFKYIAEEFYINEDNYQKDVFLPKEIAQIKQDGFFRSARMLEVYVYPVRYNPQQRILQFYPTIELNISYQCKQDGKIKRDTLKHFKELIKELVIIPEAEAAEIVTYLNAGGLRNVNNDIDYLIITHSDFYSSMELADFASYRANYDSFNIGIVAVEDIYGQFPDESGDDYSIRDFVKYAYDNWQTPPSYLLLVGDVEWVPSHLVSISNDDWFAYVSGDDNWADMAVGRFSARTVEQIGYIKDKIISYEQGEIMAGDYREKATLLNASLGKLSTLGYNVINFNNSIEYTKQDVIDAFGVNFVSYEGHGGTGGWAFIGNPDPSGFGHEDIDTLSNINQYPIVMTLSCSTADIKVPERVLPGGCFGEAMVNAQEKGAVAYYGATTEVGPNNVIGCTLEEIFDNFRYSLGEAILFAEIKGGMGEQSKQILLGDPALHAFGHKLTPAQPDLTIASQDISYDGRTEELLVKVTNLGNVEATDAPVKVLLYEIPQVTHTFAEFTIPSIPAKSSVETNLTVAPPLRGEYLIVAKIDPEDIIEESFELNNQNGRKINTINYSEVTVLDENDQPASGTSVTAYDLNDVVLSADFTDEEGKVRFYIEEGLEVYFKAKFGTTPPRSYVYSDVVTAPADVTINKPQQVSTLTVLNEGLEVTYFTCRPYDLDGRELGLGAGGRAEIETFDFYIKEGIQFYFVVIIGNSSVYQPGTEISSEVLTAPANATLNLSGGKNHPPVLDPIGNKVLDEGILLVFNISATDADGDSLTYSASNLPSGASFDASTQAFSWTPTYVQAGSYSVTFEVSDGSLIDSETISITVNNVNRPPILSPVGDKSVAEGNLLEFTLSATDPDGDTLSYSASNLPQGASFNVSTRTFGWKPNQGQAGTYSVTFTVSDGRLSDSEQITITVSQPPKEEKFTFKGDVSAGAEKRHTVNIKSPGAKDMYVKLTWNSWYDLGLRIYNPQGKMVAEVDKSSYYNNVEEITLTDLPPGNWQVAAKSDSPWGSISYTIEVKVTYKTTSGPNNPPVANAGPDKSCSVGESLTFDGSGSSDPDGSIVSYDWDFGDGSTGAGMTTTHSYSTPKTYTVTLIVKDNGGLTNKDTLTVTVSEAPKEEKFTFKGDVSAGAEKRHTVSVKSPGAKSMYVKLTWGGWAADDLRLRLYDPQGKMVAEVDKSAYFNNVEEITIQNLQSGNWQVAAKSDNWWGSISYTIEVSVGY